MEKATAITLIIMIGLAVIVGFVCLAWVNSPTEFTILFEVENETLDTLDRFNDIYENQSGLDNFVDGELVGSALKKYSGGNE